MLNSVVVALAQQTDNVTWLVNNDGEEASDVTTQYVDVQRCQLRYSGVVTAEYHLAGVLACQPNLSFNDDGIGAAAQTADAFVC